MARPAWASSAAGAAFKTALAALSPSAVTSLKDLGGQPNFPLTASTTGLRAVPNNDFVAHFGPNAQAAFRSIRQLQAAGLGGPGSTGAATTVRVCVPYARPAEYATTCAQALNAAVGGSSVTFTCQIGGTPAECMSRVAAGTADVTKFGGGLAGLPCSSRPVLPMLC
jgi:hypothetical protein